MSRLIRGSSESARFFVLDTRDIVEEALKIHKSGPLATEAFGRLLTGGLIMGSLLKGEDILTLRTDTSGALNNMLVTADASGNIKGYMSNPGAEISFLKNDQGLTLQELVGEGTIRIIKDMGLKEPYIGIASLKDGGISRDLAEYYNTSEQTPTFIDLGVSFNDDMSVRVAGGYMIQLLPGARPEFVKALEEKISNIRSVTELLEGGMSLERIVKLLYEDITDENHEKLLEHYEILGEINIAYECDCHKEKFKKGLITLGQEELSKIFEEDGGIEVQCHFCGEKYDYKEDEFEK